METHEFIIDRSEVEELVSSIKHLTLIACTCPDHLHIPHKEGILVLKDCHNPQLITINVNSRIRIKIDGSDCGYMQSSIPLSGLVKIGDVEFSIVK